MDASVILCALLLAAILIRAAWGDIRARDIPNAIPIALVALAPCWWWASGMPGWPALAVRIGVAVLLFAILYVAWLMRMIGGGDVKLLAALGLWFAPLPLLNLLAVMAIAGGIVTVVALVEHRARRREGVVEVPYGVAIAIAGLWAMTNEILTNPVR